LAISPDAPDVVPGPDQHQAIGERQNFDAPSTRPVKLDAVSSEASEGESPPADS